MSAAAARRRLQHVLSCTAGHAAATSAEVQEEVPDYALSFKPLPDTTEEMADLIRTDGFIRFPSQITPEHCDQLVANIFSLQPEARWNDGFPQKGPDTEYVPHLVGTPHEGTHAKGDYHLKNMWNRHADFLNLVDQAPVIDTVEAVMGAESHIIGLTGYEYGNYASFAPFYTTKNHFSRQARDTHSEDSEKVVCLQLGHLPGQAGSDAAQ
eukprot:COSAG06_NODE_3102_length_5858_cov_6.861087_4_plen_210_part_00